MASYVSELRADGLMFLVPLFCWEKEPELADASLREEKAKSAESSPAIFAFIDAALCAGPFMYLGIVRSSVHHLGTDVHASDARSRFSGLPH
jgi:hypothetical protein